MKIDLPFDFFKSLCIGMAEKIKEYKPDEVVAIIRGGLTPSHIIAKHLNIPIGVYFPKTSTLLIQPESKNIVFIEDLVATGRTYKQVSDFMLDHNEEIDWMFAPVLLDSKINENATLFDPNYMPRLLTYGMKTEHWIVMPYEEHTKVSENDRGLFRDKSDNYGK